MRAVLGATSAVDSETHISFPPRATDRATLTKIWVLKLECGHKTIRPYSETPPRRAGCQQCAKIG